MVIGHGNHDGNDNEKKQRKDMMFPQLAIIDTFGEDINDIDEDRVDNNDEDEDLVDADDQDDAEDHHHHHYHH